ncbi:MAG TPA: 2-amino-4-hydroxy-6-hydroxymethyldihydropteridine diphosphokinase [Jatrophihabitans sp.]|nr:2-amino-4-hydroxy-6-hydroxymethyldihydropteridine diphosphokinase [Jatrophihabitans sp.]
MSRAVLSIGSNIEDRLAHLQLAVDAFRPQLVTASPVFQTPPWGPVEQDPFLNAILIVQDAGATPGDWLERAQQCEQAAGRVRVQRWGPRTLDVDVITVDEVRSDDPVLTLPHPRAADRAFVLVPWWAADPEATLPGFGSVLHLIRQLPPGEAESVRQRLGLELRT